MAISPTFRRFAPFKPGGKGPALRSARLATSITSATPSVGTGRSPASAQLIGSLLNIRQQAQALRVSNQNPAQNTAAITAKAFDFVQDNANQTQNLIRDLSQSIADLDTLLSPLYNIAGRLFYKGQPTPPTNDTYIQPGYYTVWVNESTNELTFRVRYSDGALKTGVVALV